MSDAAEAAHNDGIEINSTIISGPIAAMHADPELVPLLSRLTAVISSAAVNLSQSVANETDERGASSRLCSLAALIACGEIRALILLCTSGLALEGRIHLRSLNECMKRIAVYFKDGAFALETERSLSDFKADGISKIDKADQDSIINRDETARRIYDQVVSEANPPLRITNHEAFKKGLPIGLDAFQEWYYSQAEHCTPLALAEISNRLSTHSERMYHTADGWQLLTTAAGIAMYIAAHLVSLGVEMRTDLSKIEAHLIKILQRSQGEVAADDVLASRNS